jgi:cellulose synthase (UDP-forming)
MRSGHDAVRAAEHRHSLDPPIRRERATFGGWFADHPASLHAVAVLALAQGSVFLTWRLGWSWNGASPVLWFLLLVTEIFGYVSLSMQTWMSWSVSPPRTPTSEKRLTVDVYVCTYDEPLDILRATLQGARLMRHEHVTYVLDDGRRPEVAELAQQCGAKYLTRPDNSHAKAGNINAALTRTSGDLVFVLDADHVPMPDSLEELVGYFVDDSLALVQSPHDFYNHDSIQHYDVGRHEQSVFFRVVCPGKDRHGAAFWCGSAALIRREALLSIDGVATETIAEDFHTTIRLQTLGWTTRYHDRLLVQGVAPHDLAAYLLQRDRWARGNLAVLTTAEHPLKAANLSPAQRINHLATLGAYLAGPVRLLTLFVLAVVLWTGLLPMTATTTTLLFIWLPWVVLSMLAGSALSRGYMRIGEAVHFEQLTGWIYTRALRCAVRPGRAAFRVTPKEGIDDGGWTALRQLPVLLALATAVVGGTVARIADAAHPGLLPALPGIAWWLLPALGLLESRRVGRTLLFVARRRQRRSEPRFPTVLDATVVALGHRDARGTTIDVSTRGLHLVVDAPIEVGEMRQVRITLPSAQGSAVEIGLDARVLSCRERAGRWRVRFAVDGVASMQALHELVSWCYVWSTFASVRQVRAEREDDDARTPGHEAPAIPGRRADHGRRTGATSSSRDPRVRSQAHQDQ